MARNYGGGRGGGFGGRGGGSCFNCGSVGHFAQQCPKSSKTLTIQVASPEAWQNQKGLTGIRELDFAKPQTGGGWKYCGHFHRLSKIWVVRDDTNSKLIAPPIDWVMVWKDEGSKCDLDYTVWVPMPPLNFVSLGCYLSFRTNGKAARPKPNDPDFVCVHESVVKSHCLYRHSDLWSDKGSGAKFDVTLNGKPDGLLWPSNTTMFPTPPPNCLMHPDALLQD